MLLQQILLHVKTFLQRKDGASGIEYAVIAAMVAVVLAGFVTPISTEVSEIMTKIQTAITQ
ncbi:pilus assembly protein Flp/PilA [Pseudomonas sp. TE6288]|uniref:Flp family type IVb pilin n=1 Tax=Pseudomonas TaxID=286 RepID=UPI000DAD53BE|nr:MULTISPECIES: Flp family type IVb pilin [Pseudomonas]MBI6953328.1 Flp family type IVb pilin [Pseudomonas sp. CCOS 191]MDF9753523.1 pilus assembly protein Flp/PilA [Pseudomonas hunanensis]PZW73838.1 pilus assembly protein Flp/PilA [Pseudomonas sp. 2848]UVL20061.1 Flp family type IVb pilin [Pseudomonas sp. B21-044]UVM17458.1 Flp family type IVb pilin [Pseudomonas sp. B21-023]